MATHEVKRGDTAPTEATLRQRSRPAQLGGATVRFHMRQRQGAKSVVRVCDVVDATKGEVEIPWGATDLDTPGVYDAEFEVTFADGTEQTFPNDGFETVKVVEDLA